MKKKFVKNGIKKNNIWKIGLEIKIFLKIELLKIKWKIELMKKILLKMEFRKINIWKIGLEIKKCVKIELLKIKWKIERINEEKEMKEKWN